MINKKGDIVWAADQLTDGDFPKLPEFTRFDIGRVQGEYKNREGTHVPVVQEDPELPVGCYRDDAGKVVNTLGFLIDADLGHVVDEKGNMVFDREELVDEGQDIPFVFRKIAINGKDSPLSEVKRDQFETSEEEMEEEGAMLQ